MRLKTKEEKEIQGTYEPSREGDDPVEYDKYEISPIAPREWPPNIQKLWLDRCNDLKKAGYLVRAFVAPLRRYCFAVLMAEKAEEMLLRDGFVTIEYGVMKQEKEVVSKWVMVLDQANKTIDRFGAKFGFSPLDVQRIPIVRKEVNSETLLK